MSYLMHLSQRQNRQTFYQNVLNSIEQKQLTRLELIKYYQSLNPKKYVKLPDGTKSLPKTLIKRFDSEKFPSLEFFICRAVNRTFQPGVQMQESEVKDYFPETVFNETPEPGYEGVKDCLNKIINYQNEKQ